MGLMKLAPLSSEEQIEILITKKMLFLEIKTPVTKNRCIIKQIILLDLLRLNIRNGLYFIPKTYKNIDRLNY